MEPARDSLRRALLADEPQRHPHGDASAHERPRHDGARALHRERTIHRQPRHRPAIPPLRFDLPERLLHGGPQRVEPLPRPRGDEHRLRLPSISEERERLLRGELRQLVARPIHLRYRDDGALQAQELARRHVLPRLRHHALVGGDDEEHELDPRRACDHRVDEPPVPRHVDDADREAVAEIPRREPQLDRDPAPLLLGEPVRVDARERLDERRLAVIDVPRSTDDEPLHARTLPDFAGPPRIQEPRRSRPDSATCTPLSLPRPRTRSGTFAPR